METEMIDIKKRRTNLLNIPIDAITQEDSLNLIKKCIQAKDGQNHQIVFLNLKKILKARRDKEYLRCIKNSTLTIPVSLGIIHGARFQKKPKLTRYYPFEFIIRLLSLGDELKLSVYLLGGKKKDLERAEDNLRTSFPNLQIVGRYTGYFDKPMENNILMAIKKASPTFLLIGSGIKNSDKWILNNKDNLNPGIFLSVNNCFEIFSGKKKNISKKLFKFGLESLPGIIKKPWRLIRIFPYLYFKILVLIYKIRCL